MTPGLWYTEQKKIRHKWDYGFELCMKGCIGRYETRAPWTKKYKSYGTYTVPKTSLKGRSIKEISITLECWHDAHCTALHWLYYRKWLYCCITDGRSQTSNNGCTKQIIEDHFYNTTIGLCSHEEAASTMLLLYCNIILQWLQLQR